MNVSTLAPQTQTNEDALEAIGQTVEKVRQTFADGRTRNYDWRARQLQQIKKMTLEQKDRINQALQADLHKGEVEAWVAELGYVVGEVEHTLKHLKKWMQPRKVATPLVAVPSKSHQLPEPLGCVLIIGAWNYPFQLILAPLVAAIAAGNCAVVKPSELSSHTAAVLAELIPQYLDKEAVAVVQGAVPETTELLKQKFDHILYTGGEKVGKIVMHAAAEHLTPVTLELGGKSPCIVDASADLNITAARIVWSKWMNAGQTCVAPDYVLVQSQQADELIRLLIKKLKAFYGEQPQLSKDYGRIINARHYQRVLSYLDDQEILHGGQHDEQSRYIAPTLVLDPALDSPLMREEVFGPVLPIIRMDNIQDAVAFVKQRPKPLALYVYTKDDAFAQQISEQTSAGNMCINDGFMFMANPDLAFGGVGNSGMGAYHGRAGFDTFSHLKAVMKRYFFSDVVLRYPPFSGWKFSLLKKLF